MGYGAEIFVDVMIKNTGRVGSLYQIENSDLKFYVYFSRSIDTQVFIEEVLTDLIILMYR